MDLRARERSVAPPGLVKDVLMERFDIKDEEAGVLGNFSSGRIGEAIRMREQNLIAKKNNLIDSLTGGKEDFFETISACPDRKALKESLEFLASFFRDAFLCKTAPDAETFFNADRLDEIKRQSERFTSERLEHIIKRIIELRSYLDYNVNPKIVIDVLAGELGKPIHGLAYSG